MLNSLKRFLFGSPIKGEPIHYCSIHHTVMPVDVSLEQWGEGYYSKFLNNIK